MMDKPLLRTFGIVVFGGLLLMTTIGDVWANYTAGGGDAGGTSNSIAIGSGSGSNARAKGDNSIAIEYNSTANGTNSITAGADSIAYNPGSIAIGYAVVSGDEDGQAYYCIGRISNARSCFC